MAKKSMGDITFVAVNSTLLIILAFVTLFPFWHILVVSFNDAIDSIKGGPYFWPREFTLLNYKKIFENNDIGHATIISLSRTIIGTTINVFCHMMLAYTLSRREYIFRKFITTFYVLTMYFSGGLIPGYMLIRNLGLTNTFLVYIIPGLIGAYGVIIARTFIQDLPASIIESAKIDGAGEFKIFIKLIFPLAMPVVAVLALFAAVGHWNSWFDVFLYNSSRTELHTLQYKLMSILQQSQSTMGTQVYEAKKYSEATRQVTPNSIRAAMTIVATTPILLVYPFLQKYFVGGLVIGGVKE